MGRTLVAVGEKALVVGAFAAGALAHFLWHRKVSARSSSSTALPALQGKSEAPQDSGVKAEVAALKARLWGLTEATFTAMMIATGDRLGLFRTLSEAASPMTTAELALAAGLTADGSERWVREWCYQQTAARLVQHDGSGRFTLSPAVAEVLVDAEGRHGEIGLFPAVQAMAHVSTRLPESFASGVGLPYDEVGNALAEGLERLHLPVAKFSLVPIILPELSDGGDAAWMAARQGKGRGTRRPPAGGERQAAALLPRLRAGGLRVADVGCGGGMNLIELARAFPGNEFHGFELSQHALERARANSAAAAAAGADMTAVYWHDVGQADRAGSLEAVARANGAFDLVMCYDVLHDMAHPRDLMKEVRGALNPSSGVWLAVDIKCSRHMEENLADPGAALKYGFSLLLCMSSGLSRPGGEGLGPMGLHEALARRWFMAAGFSFVRAFSIPALPTNSFFEVRV